MRFWDASAIIHLCLREPTSPTVRRIAEQDGAFVVGWGTPVECYSAFARLRGDGLLSRTGEDQARRILGQFAEGWTEVEPSREVRENAGRVLLLHALRAADALQLAAALLWTRGRPAGRDLVCLDERLREAATRGGFAVLP